jgi:hypothetical protein
MIAPLSLAGDPASINWEGRIHTMNRITKSAMILFASAGLMLAESWSGKLIDANCKPDAKDPSATCAPTQSTRVFAVQTADGKVYRLDNSGNAKAAEAVKNDPSKTNVTVSGSLDGQMVKVESIDLR